MKLRIIFTKTAPRAISLVAAALLLAACSTPAQIHSPEDADPPEVAVGERLFFETRFAQFFAEHAGDDVNRPLAAGDPVVDEILTTGAPFPSPFQGASMNCRTCHLVDDVAERPDGRTITYADFARRSPIPARGDGEQVTPRNSPSLVDASRPRSTPFLLHLDGEFATLEDLVRATFTGRNFGWLPDEESAAIANLARVVREDDGRGVIAADFGALPYRVLLAGTDPAIPSGLRLPDAYRLDVGSASDAQVFEAVVRLVSAYTRSLEFVRDEAGEHDGSPYDAFLARNGLPRAPTADESPIAYSERLRGMIAALGSPRFIGPEDGSFGLHRQKFRFGEEELAGLIVFLADLESAAGVAGEPASGVGNCYSCHPAPDFTDRSLHDTGATQEEYDGIHGAGAFAALDVPGLDARNAAADVYLPPSKLEPRALGIFRKPPAADRPGETDLGAWNVYANPTLPSPQRAIESIVCGQHGFPPSECTPERVLPLTIATFKTPSLRDLGQSPPYLHTGAKDSIGDVLAFYLTVSEQARAGLLRNGAPELSAMRLAPADLAPLERFLESLNEDYS